MIDMRENEEVTKERIACHFFICSCLKQCHIKTPNCTFDNKNKAFISYLT